MGYILTIIVFLNANDPSSFETTTLEVEDFETCVETGYNVVNLYEKMYATAQIKCDPIN